jgi:arginyl-tRNA--protein-N-Asp/Glu arginylyltransferase
VSCQVTDEVFALYQKYQTTVHDDDPAEVTVEGFHRFLVRSPMAPFQVRSVRLPSSSR